MVPIAACGVVYVIQIWYYAAALIVWFYFK